MLYPLALRLQLASFPGLAYLHWAQPQQLQYRIRSREQLAHQGQQKQPLHPLKGQDFQAEHLSVRSEPFVAP